MRRKEKEIIKMYKIYYVVDVVVVGSLSLRDIITRRVGLALGPSRHYRKRGCIPFVYVPSYFKKKLYNQ